MQYQIFVLCSFVVALVTVVPRALMVVQLQAGRVYILRYFQCIHVDKKLLFFKENFREKNSAHFIENKKLSCDKFVFNRSQPKMHVTNR